MCFGFFYFRWRKKILAKFQIVLYSPKLPVAVHRTANITRITWVIYKSRYVRERNTLKKFFRGSRTKKKKPVYSVAKL